MGDAQSAPTERRPPRMQPVLAVVGSGDCVGWSKGWLEVASLRPRGMAAGTFDDIFGFAGVSFDKGAESTPVWRSLI